MTWVGERSLGFDLGCLYTGGNAHDAAEARGIETHDWRFVTNDSQTVRTVPIRPETPVLESLFFKTLGGFHVGPYSDWPRPSRGSLCSRSFDYCSVWTAVNDGTISEMVEFPAPWNDASEDALAAAGTTFSPADGQYVTKPHIAFYWTDHLVHGGGDPSY